MRLLRDILPQLLENMDLATIRNIWIQLGGAPPHPQVFNNYYNGIWIERGGPFTWPARSPDLASPDFYL